MLIHPWDAALDDAEWQAWLATHEHFGTLAVNNADAARAPVVVPTHFTVSAQELLVHLARPNPVWAHLEVAGQVNLTVIGDYAFIPTYWRAKAGGPDEDGVPTSYYSAVQFTCRPRIVDDAEGKIEILAAQLADLQPEGRHAPLAIGTPPYGRMLTGIRGVRLEVLRVDAKFKYDDANPIEHRQQVSANLERRGRALDTAAAAQQRRRLATVGDWRDRTKRS